FYTIRLTGTCGAIALAFIIAGRIRPVYWFLSSVITTCLPGTRSPIRAMDFSFGRDRQQWIPAMAAAMITWYLQTTSPTLLLMASRSHLAAIRSSTISCMIAGMAYGADSATVL